MTYKGYKYYYVTESGKDVPYPVPSDAKWKEKADEAGAQALIIPVTRSRPAGRDVNDDDDVTQANKKRKMTMDWQSLEAAHFCNNNKEIVHHPCLILPILGPIIIDPGFTHHRNN